MILYTPMQLELVLEGFDQNKYPCYQELDHKGVTVLVEDVGGGKRKVVKLLSTNPYDFLRPELSPGTILS
ncbi:MAG: hypothetical protein C4542_05615 [Dehalococcoidia bacterium]|nr:MAG: hypothetical protein C4542_05615 [Dehalococcoidia bacterium]